MLKREFKYNLKSFLIWTMVTVVLLLIIFLIYPMIINGENMKLINQFMEAFPEEILKTFNMDLASLDSVYGWLKTEGFVLLLLILGCYSAILGSNILLKEESDKTIEYLNSLPITRNEIVLKKSIVGISYIIFMVLTFGIVNYIGLTISGTFDIKQFVLMSITPFFSSITIFFVCLFLSTYTHKTKKMIGISLGIVLISYVLQTLSTIAKEVEFFKYLSIFTLADLRNVILNIKINPLMIILTMLLSGLFLILTLIRYNKKELI